MEVRTIQKVIQRIKEHGVTYKIESLCLDEIKLVLFTEQVSHLIETCQKLEHLSLCGCQLSSLIHIPILSNLYTLQLSHNNLESDHLEALLKFPRLYALTLDNNLIKDFTWTRFLKRTRLAELTLRDNAICQDPEYREKVYKLLGADLDVLDGIDRQGNYVEQSESSSESSDEQMESEPSGESEERQAISSESEEAEDSLQKKIKNQEHKQES